MERKNQDKKYVSYYEIDGTEYEVETSFSGSETLNNIEKFNPDTKENPQDLV